MSTDFDIHASKTYARIHNLPWFGNQTEIYKDCMRQRSEDLRVLSLFSGIGAFEKALDRLGIAYELVGYCDIDKHASKSYAAIHDVSEALNLGDITEVDAAALPKNIDLVTYGFPCQDISLAGKQKGLFNEDGTQTRSGLFFDALRIIEATKPKIAIAENVKNLTSKRFKEEFEIVLKALSDAGYNNYWQVLNATDYGIPQKRERVFIISIRKDIDNGGFKFPEPFELKLRLMDLLEDEVDEKYFVSDRLIECICSVGARKFSHELELKNKNPRIPVKENTKKGYTYATVGDSINFEQPNSKTRRGRVGRQVAQTLTTAPKQGVVTLSYTRNHPAKETDISPCLQTCYYKGFSNNNPYPAVAVNLDIRKLTPLECFRLMGFDDEDYYRVKELNSDTQLYKQAGNSIVVDVLVYIFDNLKNYFGAETYETMQTSRQEVLC